MGGGDLVQMRCIVWHHPEERVPEDLLHLLQERRVRVLLASDPYSAMALTCRTPGPTDPDRDAPSKLVMVHPDRLQRVGEVVFGLQLYAPETVTWVLDTADARTPEGLPALRVITREDLARWTYGEDRRLEQFSPPPEEEQETFLRLVHPDEGEDLPPATPADRHREAKASGFRALAERLAERDHAEPLTDEELRALLKDDRPRGDEGKKP